jgi:hypothetical protein
VFNWEESEGDDYDKLVTRLCNYYRDGDVKPKSYDLRGLSDKRLAIRQFMTEYEQLSALVSKEDITDDDRLMFFMRATDL